MQIGFIGTGSMGSMLIEALITSHAVSPAQIIASNRTRAKVERLADRFPGIAAAVDNREVVRRADVVVLCVKPFEYKHALEQVDGALRPEQILITITSPVRVEELERMVPAQVIRVVPSITNAAKSGLTLIEYGERATPAARDQVLTLFSRISHPVVVEEKFLRIASDLSSCGPAFLSFILQEMIRSAQEETGISQEAATFLTTQMVIGFAELLKQEIFTLPALQERVLVPGGITGEGLSVLREGIPGLFHEVFRRTHAKFAAERQKMNEHLFVVE